MTNTQEQAWLSYAEATDSKGTDEQWTTEQTREWARANTQAEEETEWQSPDITDDMRAWANEQASDQPEDGDEQDELLAEARAYEAEYLGKMTDREPWETAQQILAWHDTEEDDEEGDVPAHLIGWARSYLG